MASFASSTTSASQIYSMKRRQPARSLCSQSCSPLQPGKMALWQEEGRAKKLSKRPQTATQPVMTAAAAHVSCQGTNGNVAEPALAAAQAPLSRQAAAAGLVAAAEALVHSTGLVPLPLASLLVLEPSWEPVLKSEVSKPYFKALEVWKPASLCGSTPHVWRAAATPAGFCGGRVCQSPCVSRGGAHL